ncbi:MAG: hypothetical protein IIC35_07840, partial [Gemmatimonadetes bacterium]|nr:hypothetical protein [Gemmatimonadota bacterium]
MAVEGKTSTQGGGGGAGGLVSLATRYSDIALAAGVMTIIGMMVIPLPPVLIDLLEGRAAITIEVARRLQRVLGASVEFWMSRDYQYRQDISRLRVGDEEWLREFPIGDMINFGWLTPVPHPSEEATACLRFFDVPTISAWREAYKSLHEMVAFRTSPSFDSRPA